MVNYGDKYSNGKLGHSNKVVKIDQMTKLGCKIYNKPQMNADL